MRAWNALKKLTWGYVVVTCCTLHGLMLAVGYLALTKFKCVFENLQFNVTVNTNMSHPLAHGAPFDVTLKDPEKCWVPLLVGSVVGLGASCAGLTTYYIIKCKKARQEYSSPLSASPDHPIPLIDFPSGEHPETPPPLLSRQIL